MRSKFLKSLKVLFVEDEEKLATLLKNAIGTHFHKFLLAKDGEDGLELYKKFSPDIVITDIMMPNKTGLEMAKEIKSLNPNIPIVILSAFSEVDKLLMAIDVGIVKYFIKPFDPDELLEYLLSLESTIENKIVLLKDEFIFNKTTNSLYKNDKYISLTKKESLFLELLLDEYELNKYVVLNEVIKLKLWHEEVSDERLRTFVRRFRLKTSKFLLENVKGLGYMLS